MAVDVCKALEISNPSQALARLDSDERFATLISNEGAASGKSQIRDSGFYHFDTPLTRAHETEALLSGGFSKVEPLNQWQGTNILKAYQQVAALDWTSRLDF